MPHTLTVAGLTISKEKGADRAPLDTVSATLAGIDGDRHADSGLRQVSLVYENVACHFYPETPPESLPGMGRENILLAAESLPELRLLDTLEMGDVILEITKISDEVNASAAPQSSVHSRCLLSNYGFFARVAHGGTIKTGQAVRHQHRLLRAHLITVSDRASDGTYEDESGPAIRSLLDAWCREKHWGLWVETQIVPDERSAIEAALENARQSRVDLVITTGGTGVGPRDITPDVVADHVDKIIPGIMEHIRMKYGATMPMALTSRSIAATMGAALVYTLPGSTKAIPEYLEEIFKTLEHMLLLLKGLDAH